MEQNLNTGICRRVQGSGRWLRFTFCIAGMSAMISCSGAPAKRATAPEPQADSLSSLELPLPKVPADLREPAARANHVINHFWDAMDFRDTLCSHNNDFMEQNFANFISVFPYAEPSARKSAVQTLLNKAEADSAAYVLLADIAELYLYEPNSPMLNEDFYIIFLEQFAESQVLGEYGTIRPRWQLEAAKKNRPGMKAADFSYITREGERSTLRKTPAVKRLLVIFYDPDCEHCKEIIGGLREDPLLTRLVADKELQVLAVHSGEQRELWQQTASQLPAGWIVGYESGVMQESGAYVLRAMPTMYLLDSDKTVILKDVLPMQLLEFLYAEQQ